MQSANFKRIYILLVIKFCESPLPASSFYVYRKRRKVNLHSQFDSRQSGKITWLRLVKSRTSMLELSRKQENSQIQVFKSSFVNPPTHFGNLIRRSHRFWSPAKIAVEFRSLQKLHENTKIKWHLPSKTSDNCRDNFAVFNKSFQMAFNFRCEVISCTGRKKPVY